MYSGVICNATTRNRIPIEISVVSQTAPGQKPAKHMYSSLLFAFLSRGVALGSLFCQF